VVARFVPPAALILALAAPLAAQSPDSIDAKPLAISGPATVAPYKIVRLSAQNVPVKAGVVWKVRAVGATDSTGLVDWATRQNVHDIGFVAPPGVYRAELSVGSVGADGAMALDYAEILVTIGAGPLPPPGPGPGPNPPNPPGPSPAPIPGDGLRVLVVYETADLKKLPIDQLNVLYSTPVRAYLDSHCVKGPDGKTAEWRVWDQNVPTANESKVWQDAMKRPRTSLPWLVVSNGKEGFEGPLPPNTDAMLRTLQTYGGN
jgi:hypothetical protein